MATDIKYEELSVAQIKDTRSLVISKYYKGGYTLAQRLTVDESGKKTHLYLKDSIQIDDVNGLCNLRDALNLALDKISQKNS